MSLLWPWFLILLALLPLVVGVYIWALRRRRRYAVRYSSLALVREALVKPSWLRRHLPFALFVLALASLIAAGSRPVAMVDVPAGQATIILAIDVSGSMCATDIRPTRLGAAQAAALSFIQRQVSTTRIGIVAFAGFAHLVQPPTTDQAALETAVRSLQIARSTAIGSGILEAVEAIAEINPNVSSLTEDEALGQAQGDLTPEIIVVLTDGVTTTGTPPLVAAQLAAERGIRVYTIGFGTANPGSGSGCAQQFFGGGFGGGGFGGGGGGGGFRRSIDEATLMEIAAMTDGEYYSAESADALNEVFRSLPTSFTVRTELTEISFVFAALGALMAAGAMLLALWWRQLA